MTKYPFKPETLDEALDDAIGSGINYYADRMPGFVDESDFDDVAELIIKNIKAIKGLTITFKGEK